MTLLSTRVKRHKVNMAASHGGRSGRFEGLRETAEEYAFFLHLLGMDE